MDRRLPEEMLQRDDCQYAGMTLYGVYVASMRIEELRAMVALGWRKYHEAIMPKNSEGYADLLRTLKPGQVFWYPDALSKKKGGLRHSFYTWRINRLERSLAGHEAALVSLKKGYFALRSNADEYRLRLVVAEERAVAELKALHAQLREARDGRNATE
jgi:hypothetical protein